MRRKSGIDRVDAALLIGFVPILLAAAYLWGYRDRSPERNVADTAAPADRAKPGPATADRGQLRGKTKAERRKNVGLLNYPVRTDGKVEFFRLSVHARRGCTGGDLDAIGLDWKYSRHRRLLLSLEGLDKAASFKPIALSVSPQQLLNGYEAEIEVPQGQGSRQLGVFLCRDADQRGSCADKPLTDINKMILEHMQLGHAMETRDAPDRTYFFQYLLDEGDGSFSVFDQDLPSGDSFAKLKNYLQDDGSESRSDAVTGVDAAQHRMNDVQSLQLLAGPSALAIELPVMDPRSCPHH
jgi:hypothetical protein